MGKFLITKFSIVIANIFRGICAFFLTLLCRGIRVLIFYYLSNLSALMFLFFFIINVVYLHLLSFLFLEYSCQKFVSFIICLFREITSGFVDLEYCIFKDSFSSHSLLFSFYFLCFFFFFIPKWDAKHISFQAFFFLV